MQPIRYALPRAGLSHSPLSARSRRSCSTKTIGVIIPEVENPFFGLAIEGIEAVALEYGYYVVICLTYGEESRQMASLQLLANGRADGVLLHNATAASGELLGNAFLKRSLPVVFFEAATETCCDGKRSKSLSPPAAADQPAYAIGKGAAEFLFQAMRQGKSR